MHVPGERGRAAIAADLGGHRAVGAEACAQPAVGLRHAEGEQARFAQVAVVLGREAGVAVVGGGARGEARAAELRASAFRAVSSCRTRRRRDRRSGRRCRCCRGPCPFIAVLLSIARRDVGACARHETMRRRASDNLFREPEECEMDRLDDIEAFLAIVEEGSLTAAARRLRRSLQSISRSLAALERSLAVSWSGARRAAAADRSRPRLLSAGQAGLYRDRRGAARGGQPAGRALGPAAAGRSGAVRRGAHGPGDLRSRGAPSRLEVELKVLRSRGRPRGRAPRPRRAHPRRCAIRR